MEAATKTMHIPNCLHTSIHSHKKYDSLEIWVVKLQFLLIYEIMLESTATARRDSIAK